MNSAVRQAFYPDEQVAFTGINTWRGVTKHDPIFDGRTYVRIGSIKNAKMVFEPRKGGRIYDVGTDGSECHWSRVLAYEPPTRIVFSWDINLQWQIEADPERTSEIEVRFTPDGDGRTRVELEHRNLDRHGDGWEKMRDAVGSPGGWGQGLARFAEAAAA